MYWLINLNSLTIIRLFTKVILVFLSFYFNYSLNEVALVFGVLLMTEMYEFNAQQLARKYPKQYELIYATVGAMNGFLAVWLLHTIDVLNTDLYLLIFVMTILMAAVGGMPSGITTAITASVFYVYYISPSVESFSLLIRVLILVLMGILSGTLVKAATKEHSASEKYREIATQGNTAKNLKDEFLVIAHHNLRTPLTLLKAYYERLTNPETKNRDKENITRQMGNSIEKIESLTEHILTVMTVESKDREIDYKEIDLLSTVLKLTHTYSKEAEEKNITFRQDLPEKPIKMLADTNTLVMAIEKILENAITYTSEEGTVKVILKEFDTVVTIDITDTGPGIENDELENIFDQGFHRVDTLTPSSEGLGVGLYLTKLIIEQHGGTIEVRSKIGYGSTFTITLPKLTSQNFFENLV